MANQQILSDNDPVDPFQVLSAVFIGLGIVLVGTIPRNLLFAANLRYYPAIPWVVPLTGVYLWFFWRYLNGGGSPRSTATHQPSRKTSLAVSGHFLDFILFFITHFHLTKLYAANL